MLSALLAVAVVSSACAGGSALNSAPATPTSSAHTTITAQPHLSPTRHLQLGIDIDFYYSPGMNVRAMAKVDVAYIKRLGGNAVSISFPFFMHGSASSAVHANSETPPPAVLAVVARTALAAGLYVSIRPLLDEGSLGGTRVRWKPTNMAAWFASYRRFLLPYARMAQANRIPALVTGVEFSAFGQSPNWAKLDAALHHVYRGTLSYSANWGHKVTPHALYVHGVQQTIDAYKPLPLSPRSSLAQVITAWDAYGRTLPRGIIISEIGIAAISGAYRAPYRVNWAKRRPFVPEIQARWFAGACHAVSADHLGGIYFWSLGFGQSLTAPPTASYPTSFTAGPGEGAISSCFQYLRKKAL